VVSTGFGKLKGLAIYRLQLKNKTQHKRVENKIGLLNEYIGLSFCFE